MVGWDERLDQSFSAKATQVKTSETPNKNIQDLLQTCCSHKNDLLDEQRNGYVEVTEVYCRIEHLVSYPGGSCFIFHHDGREVNRRKKASMPYSNTPGM